MSFEDLEDENIEYYLNHVGYKDGSLHVKVIAIPGIIWTMWDIKSV